MSHSSVPQRQPDQTLDMTIRANRQAYLVQVEGSSALNGVELAQHDAMEILDETIVIKARSQSHYLLIEMPKA